MPRSRKLTDAQWARIESFLPGKSFDPGVTARNNRRFVEAVLWIGRTGAPWRDLPPKYGRWHTVFMRFSRWSRKGVSDRVLAALSADRDLEEVLLDSTAVRAHLHAAGAKKKHGPQALGRSRGGWGSKIHCITDALGNPLGFTLTGANEADITQANALLEKAPGAQAVTADKGYDSDALVETIKTSGAEPVIPHRSNRTTLRAFDRHKYKTRHLIENLFARLKQFRRIATRYEKLALHFAGMITLACIVVWLR